MIDPILKRVAPTSDGLPERTDNDREVALWFSELDADARNAHLTGALMARDPALAVDLVGQVFYLLVGQCVHCSAPSLSPTSASVFLACCATTNELASNPSNNVVNIRLHGIPGFVRLFFITFIHFMSAYISLTLRPGW